MTESKHAHERDHEPVPERSTLMGMLHVLRKAHMELVGEEAAHERFKQVSTRGDARQYVAELMPHLAQAREERRRHRHRGGAMPR
jgi:hypothetical protein